MKRILAAFLAVLFILAPAALAEDEVTTAPEARETQTPEQSAADFDIQDGVLVKYNGPGGAVTIPAEVTVIGPGAFYGRNDVTEVTIPPTVLSVDPDAFYGFRTLTIRGAEGTAAQACAQAGVRYRDPQTKKLLRMHVDFVALSMEQASARTAYPSTQTVDVDGTPVTFSMYALKDARGYLTHYVRVRDVALALKDTPAFFDVDWDKAAGRVVLQSGAVYAPDGSEGKTPFSGERSCQVSASLTTVNGEAVEVEAIVLTDSKGGGYVYYQLRDLGRHLGFTADWSAERGMFVETGAAE